MDIAARNESILMENPKTFIAIVKGALKKSKIIMSCNFETVCCTDLCLIYLETAENFPKYGGDMSQLSRWFRHPCKRKTKMAVRSKQSTFSSFCSLQNHQWMDPENRILEKWTSFSSQPSLSSFSKNSIILKR